MPVFITEVLRFNNGTVTAGAPAVSAAATTPSGSGSAASVAAVTVIGAAAVTVGPAGDTASVATVATVGAVAGVTFPAALATGVAAPAAFQAAGVQLAPVAGAGLAANPTAIPVGTALPALAVTASAVASPGALGAGTSAASSAAVTVAPAAVGCAATVAAPTPTGTATATAAVAAAVSTRPAPTPTATATASPAVSARTATVAAPTVNTGGTSFNQAVTHGEQLTINDVGPWAIQAVAKGSETLTTLSAPGRGFWRFDTPDEFSSTTAWPSNANDSNPSVLNDTTLHYGTVTGSPVTIDGYSIPVGTRIVQFVEFPNGVDFYAQGANLQVLFRGCRFRFSNTLDGPGLFNDNNANAATRIYMHYCDVGGTSANLANGQTGLVHIKNLGGANHRYLRGYHSYSSTFFQPNVQGCQYIENFITDYVFAYGEAGPNGNFDSAVYHNNGISCEGGLTSITILRNKILCPSPDPSTGSGATAAGQIGYGTQPGQTGYGSGTAPGRIVGQTDCIALFESNGSPNQGTSPGSILVQDNYLGGSGVCLYAGEENAGNGAGSNIHVIGNKFTTRWWTNGGQYGPVTAQPAWGSNGNLQSGNVWADDYGTGGNGSTATSSRQYPNGDGPRAGTSVI